MKSLKRTKVSKGFTLIELMIVVSIIGVLASIAVPGFQGFVLKSKRAERDTLMRGILDASKNYFMVQERWPYTFAGVTWSQLWGDFHPPMGPGWMPTGIKKNWRNPPPPNNAWTNWKDIGFSPDGTVFYHYMVQGWFDNNWGYIYVEARGDVDGDLREARKVDYYDYTPSLGTFSTVIWQCADDAGVPPWQRCGGPGIW
jgi:prepilin-type N-terminal cleavage/methylation domain-containing protein